MGSKVISKTILFLILSALSAVVAGGESGREKGSLTLLPIDDRPAVGQFARMIGAVAGADLEMPPRELLGNFTRPGDTKALGQWLRARDYHRTEALIISVDMLVYGGLVASRTHAVGVEEARRSLEFFRWFRKRYPKIPIYAFSVIMRVAPTASAVTAGVHDKLARWAELKDRVPKTGDETLAIELARLEAQLPPGLVADYLAARRRNREINLSMIDLVKEGTIDDLILLQDDARQYGLHRQDQEVIYQKLRELDLSGRVPIYNGTDEGSLSLVSRAVLDRARRQISVEVVYSSEKSRDIIAPYEDSPLRSTVEHQILAAGSRMARDGEQADYLLYVNAPGTSDAEFERFLRRMIDDLRAGRPVALADLNFPPPHASGADERIITALVREGLLDRFVGYAAWNTAGNTLGTAIPHANMRTLFRSGRGWSRKLAGRAEAAHLEFLLNRYAGDYLYHDIVRPEVNRRLREEAQRDKTTTWQLSPERYASANAEVSARMRPLIDKFFDANFARRRYTIRAKGSIVPDQLQDLRIYLPWARTFECVIEYRIGYRMEGK